MCPWSKNVYLDQRVSFSTEEEGNANIKIRIVFDNQKYALFYFKSTPLLPLLSTSSRLLLKIREIEFADNELLTLWKGQEHSVQRHGALISTFTENH